MMACTGRLGVYYEMGTGKTAIALMYIYERLQKKSNLQALVICPASLVSNWEANIEKMINFEGVTPMGVEALKKAVTVVSFQKTYRTQSKKVKKGNREYFSRTRPLREEVDKHWDILCIDEAHCIGAYNSVQSKAAWAIAKKSDERFLFTGTPVHGGGGKSDYSKLYGQMRVLHPTSWMTWTQFMTQYVTRVNPRFHNIEAYNIPACNRLMEQNAIVCRLEDCVDLPGNVDVEIECPLMERKVYNDIRDMDVEQYGIDLTTGGSPWIRLLQTCSGSLKRATDTLMMKTSKDAKLEDILAGIDGKVVIFCNFRASIDRVAEICKKDKRSYVIVDGRTKDRDGWKAFQNGPIETCICQYQSGGAGLDLYAAHHLIFYEPTPSALQYSQARGRIYRKGQTNKCVYYIFTTPKTVEARSWAAVREGLDVTDKMLEEWSKLD